MVPVDNSGTVTDSAIGIFDFAIATICAWLVPHLISRHRLYHRTLRRSPNWVRDNSTNGLESVELKVTNAFVKALLVSVLIYTITAVVLSLLTRDIDNRTSYIIVGLSNLVGSLFFFLLSYSAPQWLGVYASIYDGRRTSLGGSVGALCFKVRLHVYRTFFKVYPMMIPFFLGAQPATIPISVMVGCNVGFFMCFAIDYGNRNIQGPANTRKFAYLVAFLFIIGSALMFSYGCGYVEEVWGNSENETGLLEILSFVAWVVAGVFLHLMAHKYSDNIRKSGMHKHSEMHRPKTFFGKSVFMSRAQLDVSSKKGLAGWMSRRTGLGRSSLLDRSGRMRDKSGKSFDGEKEHPVPAMDAIEEGEDESQSRHQSSTRSLQMKNDSSNKDAMRNDSSNKDAMETVQEVNPEEAACPRAAFADLKAVSTDDVANEAEENLEDLEPEEDDDVDKCHLCNLVCCDLNCGPAGREKPFKEKCNNCCLWTLWGLLMAASLFIIVLLIGAQKQETEVRNLLPRVHKILYTNMNNGTMCAYNDNYDATTIRERVEATQRTFPTPEEAHLAGYKILHCGSCSACSNYPDMRQQWTTREILGQVALTCAKKVLLGGGFSALRECTMEKTGFEYDCATCWTQDYVCVKSNCIFISIRAFIINTVTNLQVGEGDITPSACEEAKCEATEITGYIGFVPCSGASRRRMDIKSSIKRPIEQQCTQVDVPSWADFFGPSTGHGEYPEDWGATEKGRTVDWE